MKRKLFVLATAMILLFALGASACSSFSGDETGVIPANPNQNTGIWVTGVGTVTVTPDLAVLSIGVQAQALTVAEAQQQAVKAMADVIAALKTNSIADKDIATTAYSITPVYTYNQKTGMQSIIGYSVSNNLSVKIRTIANAGAVIDSAAAAGGDYTRINSVTLTVDQPDKYNDQARELAMADASNRAKQLAKLGGVKLGKATYINESINSPWQTISFDAGGKAAPSAPTTTISPGETEITLMVQVVYNLS
jgi:uncharacterized protein